VFLCQPLLPVLYLFWPSYFILAAVVMLAWVWVPIANRYVSYGAATVGCLWVRLKWPAMLVATLYYSWKHAFYLALLTLATPFIAQLLIRLVPKADLAAIQRKMMAEIGFDPSQEGLNRTVDRLKSGLKSILD
jgi:hypothetical protein